MCDFVCVAVFYDVCVICIVCVCLFSFVWWCM